MSACVSVRVHVHVSVCVSARACVCMCARARVHGRTGGLSASALPPPVGLRASAGWASDSRVDRGLVFWSAARRSSWRLGNRRRACAVCSPAAGWGGSLGRSHWLLSCRVTPTRAAAKPVALSRGAGRVPCYPQASCSPRPLPLLFGLLHPESEGPPAATGWHSTDTLLSGEAV